MIHGGIVSKITREQDAPGHPVVFVTHVNGARRNWPKRDALRDFLRSTDGEDSL